MRVTNITISPAARSKIEALLASSGKHALRVGLKGGGCAGFSYEVTLADDAEPGEEVIEDGGARVLIRPEALMFLLGTQVDYEESLLSSGFRFNNPNVANACGCGESISFR